MGSRPVREDLYRRFHEAMPLACLDLVVVRDQKVLLLRRLREPAKGSLWFPGAALQRGEELEDAVKRIAREETGMLVRDITLLGVDNLVFDTDPFGHGKGTHVVSIIFGCKPANGEAVTLDQDHSGHVWSDGADQELHGFLRRFILLARHR